MISLKGIMRIIWISEWLRVECESLIKWHTAIIYIYTTKKWFINVDNILLYTCWVRQRTD